MKRCVLLLVLLLTSLTFATVPVSAGGGGAFTEVVWSPDGATLAVIMTRSAAPGIWLHDSSDLKAEPRQVWPTSDAPDNSAGLGASFSPDGTVLATGHADAKVRLWNMETLEQVGEISDLQGAVLMVKYSPDGALLATVVGNVGLLLWDAASYEQITSLPMPHNETNVAFSPDSSILAYGMCDPHDPKCLISGIALWDIANRADIGYVSVPSSSGKAYELQFTPAGDQIAFRDRGDKIHVLDLANATTEPVFTPLIETGYEMGFNADGTRLTTVIMGGSRIVVWDCETHSQLWMSDNIQMTNILEYFTHPQFSPDGSMVAAGTAAGTGALVWDAETGEPVATLKP